MPKVVPTPLDEPTRVAWWLHERMLEACGDERLADELVFAGADYRRVHKARINGASLSQVRRIFGDALENDGAAG